ncbi:HSP70-domain-containing protein [Coniophora puteana RWD-64-598 SS2]|uniref:HSP70-domain-containing protein n=1 Tax=Coniophora puteana (strain RWD-64-598) TaxID=741705 RepID=A0A5M3MXQ3_CONPW|nr:HSP70-domain-containing protein [Coniophora puteana RWD-64-598 SS2]EIW83554.1 HSP70-domain-containing protein [Coniophora puteana RWD-64-598 SS2]
MAVVGIDFGTLHSKIGVARNRGIDIIVNEVSNRATPSLVAFGPKQRSIGEAAKTQETSNFKNTIGCLKRLIGRTLADPEIQEEKKFLHANLVDVNGTVGAEVTYVGEKQIFSATQLVAMYLGKIRDITSNELKVPVTDLAIAVPGWYTDIQRRALLDAASIAGLNALRLINDTTAVALGYGITKSDLPEPENPRHVMFVDVGHSSMSVAVVAFSKGQLTVKSTAYDRHIGGRYIDYTLLKHFAEEFKTKYKIDVMSSPKAQFRLAAGCERLKKVLSANSEAPLNVESIMNDVDASSRLTREEYEALLSDLLNRIAVPLEQALKESGLTIEQIDTVELVGGSTRVPAVRQRIQAALGGKTLSTTLNQDEAIARGTTFACAFLSPTFRVREFTIHDITHYPIKVNWESSASDPDDDTELLVFPRGNGIPSTKVLTFYRKGPFDIEAQYAEPEGLPGGINPWLAKFTAKSVPPDPNGDLTCVKLKTRLNLHGIMSFESAYVEEVEEREEAMPVDGDDKATPKKKKVVRKKEIPFVAYHSSLDSSLVEKFKEQEAQMYANDKLVMDTEDRKNALEEYVYDMRGKLDNRYASYVQPQEKEQLLSMLQEAEDWLYSEEGEDATKSAYVAKLDGLKKIGDPIVFRWREANERAGAISQLRSTLNDYMAQATSGDERYSHIDDKDKQAVIERCANTLKWLDDQVARQSERPKNVDPVLTSADIVKKKDEIIYFAIPILTKPKPKPVVTPSANTPSGPGTQTPQGDAQSGTRTPQGGAQSGKQTPDPAAGGEAPKAEEPQGPSGMDVD